MFVHPLFLPANDQKRRLLLRSKVYESYSTLAQCILYIERSAVAEPQPHNFRGRAG